MLIMPVKENEEAAKRSELLEVTNGLEIAAVKADAE